METRVTEVGPGIHQLTTYLVEMDFSLNQYLVGGNEPLLFHTGMRGLFPLVSEAAARVMFLDSVRWIGFGHVEADECGSMNNWLACAPRATIVQGSVGCMVSISDLADRPPRPARRRRGSRHRRSPDALDRHPAPPPRLGGQPSLRRDDPHVVLR